jgi:hypothetical protein
MAMYCQDNTSTSVDVSWICFKLGWNHWHLVLVDHLEQRDSEIGELVMEYPSRAERGEPLDVMQRRRSTSRASPKLQPQAQETALINQIVQLHFVRKQLHRLRSQVKPLDVDLAVRAITSRYQKAEPIDVLLENAIRLLLR